MSYRENVDVSDSQYNTPKLYGLEPAKLLAFANSLEFHCAQISQLLSSSILTTWLELCIYIQCQEIEENSTQELAIY